MASTRSRRPIVSGEKRGGVKLYLPLECGMRNVTDRVVRPLHAQLQHRTIQEGAGRPLNVFRPASSN